MEDIVKVFDLIVVSDVVEDVEVVGKVVRVLKTEEQ